MESNGSQSPLPLPLPNSHTEKPNDLRSLSTVPIPSTSQQDGLLAQLSGNPFFTAVRTQTLSALAEADNRYRALVSLV